MVRRKVAAVRSACGFGAGQLPGTKPWSTCLKPIRARELIETATDDLQRIASGIVMLQEHPRVRVFLRDDTWGRYVSALVYMPRDRFDTTMRQRITALLSANAASRQHRLLPDDRRVTAGAPCTSLRAWHDGKPP